MRNARFAVALAVVAAVLALPAGASNSAEGDARDTVTVTGNGTAVAVPDTTQWTFGVEADAPTATAALRAVSAEMRRVLAALRAAGLASRDLQTQHVSLNQRRSENGERVLGYSATNAVVATIRDAAKTGAVVDGAVEAGANNVFGPSFGTSDRKALYRQALAAAFDDAKVKAQALAQKAGATVGKAVSIVEGGGTSPGPVPTELAKAASDSVPIEPGEQEIAATATVTFLLS
jgi:uncharacterized protein YggE